jgi:hypothetical protein
MSKNKEKTIVTASSDEYFPWLLNLIGSIQANYPNYPKIVVYDLGLRAAFLRELKSVENVEVRKIAKFASFWRSCYTWKLYALLDAPGELIYYLDAGSEVLKPLDEVFNIIDSAGYFCVDNKFLLEKAYLKEIIPPDLLKRLSLDRDFPGERFYFSAGNFGYKKNTLSHESIKEAFDLAKEGWTLGFSKDEIYRSVGTDRTTVIRDCKIFRHDQTLLNTVFYKNLGDLRLYSGDKYCGNLKNMHPDQLIWNCRRHRNKLLAYWNKLHYNNKNWLLFQLNRWYSALFLDKQLFFDALQDSFSKKVCFMFLRLKRRFK